MYQDEEQKSRMRWFNVTYYAGLGVALACALASKGAWLPYVALPHLVALAALGLWVKGQRRATAGTKGQLMGYTHTLGGVMGALVANTDDPSQMWGAIGAALLTSVIGWSVGWELLASACGEEASATSLDDLLTSDAELDEGSLEPDRIKKDWLALQRQMRETIRELHRVPIMLASITQATGDAVTSARELSKTIGGANRHFSSISISAGNAAKSCEGLSDLVQRMDELVSRMMERQLESPYRQTERPWRS